MGGLLVLETQQFLLGIRRPALLLQGPDELEAHLHPLGTGAGEEAVVELGLEPIAQGSPEAGEPETRILVGGTIEEGQFMGTGRAQGLTALLP